jgi:hypothetical protein
MDLNSKVLNMMMSCYVLILTRPSHLFGTSHSAVDAKAMKKNNEDSHTKLLRLACTSHGSFNESWMSLSLLEKPPSRIGDIQISLCADYGIRHPTSDIRHPTSDIRHPTCRVQAEMKGLHFNAEKGGGVMLHVHISMVDGKSKAQETRRPPSGPLLSPRFSCYSHS